MDEVKALKKEIEELKKAEMNKGLRTVCIDEAKECERHKADHKAVRMITTSMIFSGLCLTRSKADNKGVAMVFAAVSGGKVTFLVSLTDDLVEQGLHAGKMIKEVAAAAGGGGGGKADMAQAGAKDPSKVSAAFAKAEELIQG